jgi:hypothetical protein
MHVLPLSLFFSRLALAMFDEVMGWRWCYGSRRDGRPGVVLQAGREVKTLRFRQHKTSCATHVSLSSAPHSLSHERSATTLPSPGRAAVDREFQGLSARRLPGAVEHAEVEPCCGVAVADVDNEEERGSVTLLVVWAAVDVKPGWLDRLPCCGEGREWVSTQQ